MGPQIFRQTQNGPIVCSIHSNSENRGVMSKDLEQRYMHNKRNQSFMNSDWISTNVDCLSYLKGFSNIKYAFKMLSVKPTLWHDVAQRSPSPGNGS